MRKLYFMLLTCMVAAGSQAQTLNVSVDGAHVAIGQSDDLATEITYTLSGTSSNGSFYMDGSYKASLVLSDLTLTCVDSAAVNIENGKRINIDVEGTCTLRDSESSKGKGAMMVNGHSEFTGSGELNLYGYAKHAFWGRRVCADQEEHDGPHQCLSCRERRFQRQPVLRAERWQHLHQWHA